MNGKSIENSLSLFRIGIEALVMGVVLMSILKVATGVAKELGQVSIESLSAGIGKAAQTVAGGATAGAVGGAASSISKAGIAMSAATGPAGSAMALGKGVLGAT